MVITKTPMRVSIIGGGTDYPQYYKKNHYGCVVSCAIDVYIHVLVKDRRDTDIAIHWSRPERVSVVDEIQHELIREAMKLLNIPGGVEIATIADIDSRGCGLGSSSAVLVGVLNALHAYKGTYVSNPAELAMSATYIEQRILGKPIGLQDAWPCAIGGSNYYRFYPNDDCVHYPVPIDVSRLLLFKCGDFRSADIICEKTGENTFKNTQSLNEMKFLAEDLAKGEIFVPEALRAGWDIKKSLVDDISNSTVDEWISKILAAGAEGAKLCGSGGSGYIVAYAKPELHDKIKAEIGLTCLSVNESEGSTIIYNG